MKNFQPTISVLIFVLLCGFCGTAIAAGGGGVLTDPGAMEGKHFHSKGKMPSKYTVELQNGLRKSLPFEDERDFQEAKRGFIAAPAYKQIMAEAGNVAWDIGSYEWLLAGKDFRKRIAASFACWMRLHSFMEPLRSRTKMYSLI